jgi:dienelactone hydrolase
MPALAKSLRIIVAVAALFAIGMALTRLRVADEGLTIATTILAGTPVTVYRQRYAGPRPVVVLAHGFAGSQQLMRALATTFARNGYIAVTFDFLGHGRNPHPLTGSITKADGATRALVIQTAAVCAYARRLGDGRVAILGHSMASDIVVRVAQAQPDIAATIAVSMFSPAVTRTAPRNLLVVAGEWETTLQREALRVVAQASAPAPPAEATTYGSFAAGTARRASFSPGVEHVGVLYSRASMAAALSWLDAAFGTARRDQPYLDARGPWVLLLIAGLTALAWPLSRALPELRRAPAGAGLGWRAIWPCLIVPAVATPLLLRAAPTHFLPILVGDYLALHLRCTARSI